MKQIRIMAVGLLIMLAAEGVKAQESQTQEDLDAKYAVTLVQPGNTAPGFTLNTIQGAELSLASLKGKTVVLDFWASWCPDCRKDAPEVVNLYQKYHSENLEFVGISMDTDINVWQRALGKYGITYPQVSELKKFHDTDIAKAYGVKWIPSIVVVDADGKVVLATVVVDKLAKWLSENAAQ